MWKSLFLILFLAILGTWARPQYLGLVGVPQTASTFPAYAKDPNYAANSGRFYGLYGHQIILDKEQDQKKSEEKPVQVVSI